MLYLNCSLIVPLVSFDAVHTGIVRGLYGLSQLFCYAVMLYLYIKAKVRVTSEEDTSCNSC